MCSVRMDRDGPVEGNARAWQIRYPQFHVAGLFDDYLVERIENERAVIRAAADEMRQKNLFCGRHHARQDHRHLLPVLLAAFHQQRRG